ncbi:Lysosome-associated membrane glycoprotein family-containing protein [Strongyloides ratti]|uniref:Lysosome-associated membrane glycoprotein 5 n=1 Tax=Strongyloides ratti TaxID=34506 RepID=A0A090MZI4_STRRB|nr:Lysosome-associated membrane glycoprotein family-containing protein [Strongyloides ratti]CEF68989.1 Lysosome-associated membrane glycoprotein family-containing protein [Strongyloides ratti]
MRSFVLLFLLATIVSADVYTAKTKTGKYCIVLEANITGTVTYNKKESGTSLQSYDFTVPHTAKSHGNCAAENGTQVLNIDFTPEVNATGIWHISLIFDIDSNVGKEHSFKLQKYYLYANFSDDTIFNSTEPLKKFKQEGKVFEWNASGGNTAFMCSTNTLGFTENAKLTFKNLKVVAEEELDRPYFANGTKYELCFNDSKTSDVVPIVVGACLTGLVIAVLIAYLIGRQRAKRQGYASV